MLQEKPVRVLGERVSGQDTAKKVGRRSVNHKEEPAWDGVTSTCKGPEEAVLGEFRHQRASQCCRGRQHDKVVRGEEGKGHPRACQPG